VNVAIPDPKVHIFAVAVRRLSRCARHLVRFAILTLVALLVAPPVSGGNVWNPPPPTFPRQEMIGADFLRLEGVLYSFLATVQVGDITTARTQVGGIFEQMKRSRERCSVLAQIMKGNPGWENAYERSVGRFSLITAAYEKDHLIAAQDPDWRTIEVGGYETLRNLCIRSVDEIAAAFESISRSLSSEKTPSQRAVWRLIVALETGSKRARFFTMILRP
jgi:hypothetical protein